MITAFEGSMLLLSVTIDGSVDASDTARLMQPRIKHVYERCISQGTLL